MSDHRRRMASVVVNGMGAGIVAGVVFVLAAHTSDELGGVLPACAWMCIAIGLFIHFLSQLRVAIGKRPRV